MGNNWANGVDPDGMFTWNYNVETSKFSFASLQGGFTDQIIQYMNSDGTKSNQDGSSTMILNLNFKDYNERYKGTNGKKWNLNIIERDYHRVVDDILYTSEKAFNIPDDYNRNSPYSYNIEDIRMRRYLEETDNVYYDVVQKRESQGKAIPLTNSNAIDYYGEVTLRLMVYDQIRSISP